jgi:hypothetical protein
VLGVLGGIAYRQFEPGTTAALIGTSVIAGMAGLILGMLGGILYGSLAWMFGKR